MTDIKDIIPFMRKGWVAMDMNGNWRWFIRKPYISKRFNTFMWSMRRESPYNIVSLSPFDIEPAEDWTKSLIKVENK